MENATHALTNVSDLAVNLNPNAMHYSKCLELFARWVPVCQEIAQDTGCDVPSADRLRQMILNAHAAMCLLAEVSLEFPDPVTQHRIVNQFLIDCFSVLKEG